MFQQIGFIPISIAEIYYTILFLVNLVQLVAAAEIRNDVLIPYKLNVKCMVVCYVLQSRL